MEKDIGGYFELDRYMKPMLHESAIALNSGRNCLKYLIESRNIKKILIPYFNCKAIEDTCKSYKLKIRKYHIDNNFAPLVNNIDDDEWLYVVNYYGLLSEREMIALKERYVRVIIDQAHAYYSKPIPGADNLYTCRKFFGVPDGAFLYADYGRIEHADLDQDRSWDRMEHLCGRFETTGENFYHSYLDNENLISHLQLKRMSLLTSNLLHGIDYEFHRQIRKKNYSILHKELGNYNIIDFSIPDVPYMYPLMLEDAVEIRTLLIHERIYIPILWPNVLEECKKDSLEYKFASEIIPLPCDQRYSEEQMYHIVNTIKKLL